MYTRIKIHLLSNVSVFVSVFVTVFGHVIVFALHRVYILSLSIVFINVFAPLSSRTHPYDKYATSPHLQIVFIFALVATCIPCYCQPWLHI